MFTRIRNRLTLLYTAIFAVFLITFVCVSYLGLTWVVSSELNQEVRLLCLKEAEAQLEFYRQSGKLEPEEAGKKNYDERDVSGKVFYYILDNDGNVFYERDYSPEIRTFIMGKIRTWENEEGKTETYTPTLSNGQEVKAVMTARQIYDDQRLIGTVYFGKDVTAYYKVLQQSTIILVGISLVFLLVAAITAHILAGRAMIPLKRSFARQREFVADASHELRTPLSVLFASTDVIEKDDENIMSAFSQQVLQDMKDEIRKMTGIVSNLLTLARADAGAVELFKQRFDFTPEAERIIRMLEPAAKEKDIQLLLRVSGATAVFADRERLNQLLTILVDNAIKYTSNEGLVNIGITVAESDVHSIMKIIVSDNGIGIPTEYQQRIFERFYRIDQSRSRDVVGSGLGLAIAGWIVAAHNGQISVRSETGKGSTFSITIPI